jgi:hypothetical protein
LTPMLFDVSSLRFRDGPNGDDGRGSVESSLLVVLRKAGHFSTRSSFHHFTV